jgi:hypothetical protein
MMNRGSGQASQEVCPFNVRFARPTAERDYLPRGGQENENEDEGRGGDTRQEHEEENEKENGKENEKARAQGPATSGQGSSAARTSPGTSYPALLDLIAMDEAAWDEFSRGSAIRRARRAGFLRNVAVALGNWGAAEAVPALVRALSDPEPLVRGHAAWALGRNGTAEARAALEARAGVESDAYVREEIWLGRSGGTRERSPDRSQSALESASES